MRQAAGRAVPCRSAAPARRRPMPRQDRAPPRTGRRRAARAWCAVAVHRPPRRANAPRPPPGRTARWWRCPAPGRGSGPAAAPAPGTGCAPPPPRRGRQRPSRPAPASPHSTSTSAANGSAGRAARATSSGPMIASAAAGSQRAWRPSSASMRSTTVAVSSPVCWVRSRAGPALQQARQRVGAQPPPRRGSRVEGGAFSGDRQRRARQREQRKARQQRKSVARLAGQRAGEQHRGAPGLAHASRCAERAEQHHRPGCPAAGAPLATQPSARCCPDLARLHPAARLAQTACAGQVGGFNCGQ